MYRKILVPVDGSPTSARGLREALALAKDQRAKVRLVHVVDEGLAIGVVEAGIEFEDLVDGLVKNGKAILQRARRSAEKQGVRAEGVLYEKVAGSAADSILREARKWGADLIVMGTHGRRGVRRVVLGSDAEQVVRTATVPVLLVRGR
jgi:nucleotide-binding universal stress UspA family protein